VTDHILDGYLGTLTMDVAQLNRAKGWYDEPRSFGDLIALLHSEMSEMLEAYRKWGMDDATERLCHLKGDCRIGCPTPKPEGVGAEAADVLIRLVDLCGRYGIDLEAETERKLAYNRTRSHRHGGKRL
jgi:NTP pyrophosphatase (non-canonical NTP hydrolase)